MLNENKIYILDGATGTTIQDYKLSKKDYKYLDKEYTGCHDILNITRKDIILDIHRRYIKAGSDIIETNTFNSSSISLKDYGLESYSYEISFRGAQIAKEATKDFKRKILVAGSIGPTNKSASIPTKNNILSREINFDELFESYFIQAKGLYDGGIDIFLVETIFDGLNAKAAVMACEKVSEINNIQIPIMISATVDKNGKILSGQDIKSLITSLDRDSIVSFGLNCSFGAKDLIPLIETLDKYTNKLLSIYPNAGLPNENGEYDETPEVTLNYLKKLIDNRKINIIGGCCGTTPKHIEIISNYSKDKLPRDFDNKNNRFFLAGNLPLQENKKFYLVGERTNISGSKKFKRLIEERKYEEALEIAREEVKNGAEIIDINLDDALLDSQKEFLNFLKILSNDIILSNIPLMIDSSNFKVIETALKNISGKSIINSISLKDGEDIFLKKAKIIKDYGAAIVIMAFDEKGQAITFDRKIEICKRAYDLLILNGWKGKDIVFDPNILTIGTGREEDRYHAIEFFKSVKWIKENLKNSKVIGGISNISFAFRGNSLLRQIIHERFLKIAIENGLDMAILNPNEKKLTFSKELIELVDKLINGDLVIEELLKVQNKFFNIKNNIDTDVILKELNFEEKLRFKIIEGKKENLETELNEALKTYEPLDIIQNILMKALIEVGNKFEKGELYLPQIIKSAIIMEESVKYLSPYIKNNSYKNNKGKILMCTVKGDVHDIGKNITKTVLKCNGYDIIDLGVMVDKEKIYQESIKNNVDAVTLSGLITPSLKEMSEVLELFKKNNSNIPIIVSGAATSKLHTALNLEPKYSNNVFHVTDSSSTVLILDSLLGNKYNLFRDQVKSEYEKIKNIYLKNKENIITKDITLSKNDSKHLSYIPKKPKSLEKISLNIDIKDILPEIQWNLFFAILKAKNSFQKDKALEEAYKILNNWRDKGKFINAIYKIYNIIKINDVLHINDRKIPLIRNQGVTNESLSDYIEHNDYVGLFIASIKPEDENDIFQQLLANTLIEATSKYLQKYISKHNWNVNISPAVGYPCLPDHSLKKDIFELLNANEINVKLTENFSMEPLSSICGFYIGNPKSKYDSPRIILEDQIQGIANIKNIDITIFKKYIGF
ncbi:methionine synthase [Candidatus Cetobacterium colombiensis]|uniref:Methionine synthase n=1 Tax=Candidatus Cetobacterium colombiensis TaxID=3073100 RepID=A0ABU4W9E5_9FUSO|nr:methionine synthase [Candidatus Cetobacterium colombiensis]MDX8336136.1 methionine synthase [Candidatus Cetobacterium colombiensis]